MPTSTEDIAVAEEGSTGRSGHPDRLGEPSGPETPIAAPLPDVSGVHVGGQEAVVQPRGLTVQERGRVRADEILFDVASRDTLRYAEIIAYEAWRLARANIHLTEPDRLALVWVCTECRSALWIDGASYTRVRGDFL